MSRWKRISVELSHTWPGEAYVRFESGDGTATMVRVDEDDLARIAGLKNALGSSAETSLWRVVWEDAESGQGHDVIDAPTAYHAVWELAADYERKGVTGLTFVRVESVGRGGGGEYGSEAHLAVSPGRIERPIV